MRVFKIKNNKAYTIIEVLAVIVIIGVILVLTFPLITNAIIKSKYRYYESQENTLLLAGKDYFTTERVRLPKVNNEERTINLNTLINDGYTKPILDTNKDACNQEETIVTVKRFDKGEYRYYVRLVCNDYDTEDMWEWSDYVFYDPPYDSEYEMEIRYNYQKATAIIEVEPSEWEDLTEGKEYVSDIKFVANRFPEGEEIELSPKPEPRTVYSYKDQQWKWYNGSIETKTCQNNKPDGDGWNQKAICKYNYSHTVCAKSKDGYNKGDACQWNWTKTTCQSTYTQEGVCGTEDSTEYYKGGAWVGEWEKNNLAVPQDYTSCTSRPIYLAKRCCYNFIYSGDYRNSVLVCCKEGVWKIDKETLPNCSSTADYCTSTWSTEYQYQCSKTVSKANAWYLTDTKCASSDPSGYTKGTECYWNFTRNECAASTPGTDYVKGDACSWNWERNTKEYADGYHSTAPTISGVKYQTKDTTQSQWIGPYLTNRWQTTEPEAKLDYRKRYSKNQIRYYPRHATWGGIELKEWLTKEGLEEHFQDHYGKTIEQMQAISCDDIETEVCYNIVATPMYRYRIKLY